MAKAALPTSQDDRARAYLHVLFEIKERLVLIKTMRLSTLPYGIVRELCQLQLRHICELVAIGCLVIQGDYTSSAALTDDYHPDKIFRILGNKYEGFFPQATTITIVSSVTTVAANTKPDAMTRAEMEKLWHRTGNYLHRLQIGKFFKADDHKDANFWPDINTYVSKIELLLNPHIVPMYNQETKVLVVAGLDGDMGNPNLLFLYYQPDGNFIVRHFNQKGETPFWRAL
jgi:hypothetical protein